MCSHATTFLSLEEHLGHRSQRRKPSEPELRGHFVIHNGVISIDFPPCGGPRSDLDLSMKDEQSVAKIHWRSENSSQIILDRSLQLSARIHSLLSKVESQHSFSLVDPKPRFSPLYPQKPKVYLPQLLGRKDKVPNLPPLGLGPSAFTLSVLLSYTQEPWLWRPSRPFAWDLAPRADQSGTFSRNFTLFGPFSGLTQDVVLGFLFYILLSGTCTPKTYSKLYF